MKADTFGSPLPLEVMVGDIPLGGNHPVRIQSMARTDTGNVSATFAQCADAFDKGADYMRVAVPSRETLPALQKMMQKLSVSGYRQGVIADIHFDRRLAMDAARIAHKVRINPGNFEPPSRFPSRHGKKGTTRMQTGKREELLVSLLRPLTDVCKEYGTALRIGVNAASLPLHIVQQMGNSPEAIAETAIEYGKCLAWLSFRNAVLSLKSSSPETTHKATLLLTKRMGEEQLRFPLHIGVTEAGWGISGRVRSAIGIIPLLEKGIGNTVRISLTEPPANEILFAKALLAIIAAPSVSADKQTSRGHPLYLLRSAAKTTDELIADASRQFLSIDPLQLRGSVSLEASGFRDPGMTGEILASLHEAAGPSRYDTAFISCPACARVQMNMEDLCNKAKETLSGLPGCTIAIMGCNVNGPGEMAGADFGVIASGKNRVHVYKEGAIVYKHLSPAEAMEAIRKLASGEET